MTARARLVHVALLVAGAVCLITALGCSSKPKVLRTSLTALNAGRDGFVAWDAAHQQTLVEKATTREEAVEALHRYRDRRVIVLEAFRVAYAALATAALDPTDTNVAEVLRTGTALVEAVKALKGTP